MPKEPTEKRIEKPEKKIKLLEKENNGIGKMKLNLKELNNKERKLSFSGVKECVITKRDRKNQRSTTKRKR